MAPLVRVIGSLNTDVISVADRYPDLGETVQAISFNQTAGGKGANQAVSCARLTRSKPDAASTSAASDGDVIVQIVGAVGGLDMHFPTILKPILEEAGIDISGVRVKENDNTGVSVIVVTASDHGENRICFSPNANFSGMPPEENIIKQWLAPPVPDIVIMQGEIPLDTIVGILRDIKSFKGKKVSEGKAESDTGPVVIFNPAPAPPEGLPSDTFAAIDHLIMNETEADTLAPTEVQVRELGLDFNMPGPHQRTAQYYHKIGVSLVVVTLGSKGAWYSACDIQTCRDTGKIEYFTKHVDAAAVRKVIDTTAAGDTFVGAYATHLARWREDRKIQGRAGAALTKEEKQHLYSDVIDAAIQRGALAAARCVEREGAMPSIPWENELSDF